MCALATGSHTHTHTMYIKRVGQVSMRYLSFMPTLSRENAYLFLLAYISMAPVIGRSAESLLTSKFSNLSSYASPLSAGGPSEHVASNFNDRSLRRDKWAVRAEQVGIYCIFLYSGVCTCALY